MVSFIDHIMEELAEIVNIYVKTSGKTDIHRFYQIGSAAAYYLSYVPNPTLDQLIQAPHLDMTPGVKYRFHTYDVSMASHDVRFYYNNSKGGGALTNASKGVDIVYAGTAGQAGAYSDILIHDDGPSSIAYQCINHPYMGNHITTNSLGTSRIYQTDSSVGIVGNFDANIDGGEF
jgi:hypothetical protein